MRMALNFLVKSRLLGDRSNVRRSDLHRVRIGSAAAAGESTESGDNGSEEGELDGLFKRVHRME